MADDFGIHHDTVREADGLFTGYAGLVRAQNLALVAYTDKIMSLDEAYDRYIEGGRPPKLLRMLRALWRVKDA